MSAKVPIRKRAIVGVGRLLLWTGGSALLGRDTGRTRAHAHPAIQVALSFGAPFQIRCGEGDWQATRGAIVMPHRNHQFDGCGTAAVMLFVEPETVQGRNLMALHGHQSMQLIDDARVSALAVALRQGFDARSADSVIAAAALDAIHALAGSMPSNGAPDPRIELVLSWLRTRLDGPVTLAEAAAVAHLSPDRFRHLFVEHTGVPFRAWLLWARVGEAVRAGLSGQSWTQAAQHAGFADSAHLSRTCRRMLGVSPAMLVAE